MGAWTFVRNRFLDRFGRDLRFVGRSDAASPAVGSSKMHAQQQEKILSEAVAPAPAVGSTATVGGGKDSTKKAPGKESPRTPTREATAGKS